MQSKAPDDPKARLAFAQRLEVLQRKYLWPTVAPVDGGANVTELADIFEVEWEEPVVDVSLVDEELGPWPVIAMLDDDRFRTFDPVADRDSLSEITYSRAFGEILNLVGDLRFPPRPALFSTPPGEPPYAGVLKKGASCVDVACGPRALTRNSSVAGEQAREGDEEPCERGLDGCLEVFGEASAAPLTGRLSCSRACWVRALLVRSTGGSCCATVILCWVLPRRGAASLQLFFSRPASPSLSVCRGSWVRSLPLAPWWAIASRPSSNGGSGLSRAA